jgi:hypothetical protein
MGGDRLVMTSAERILAREFDGVVVVGAGAAGLAAAISVAQLGVKVALLEQGSNVGGIVAHGLIHTIGGLYDSKGQYINQGLPVELARRLSIASSHTQPRKMGRVWVLNACPNIYLKVVRDWISEESNLTLFLETTDIRAIVQGKRVSSVEFSREGQKFVLHPIALIDCTGDASVIGSLGSRHVIDDGHGALAGMIFRMRGVPVSALAFPKNVIVQRRIQSAVSDGFLPTECAGVWIDQGVFDDEVYLKWSVAVERTGADGVSESGVELKIVEAMNKLVLFLFRFPAFAKAEVVQTGRLCSRGGSRIKGEYQLSVADVRGLREFPDAACRCSWPIEYWNPAKGVQMEYLDSDGSYEIPLRSFKAADFENLWAAGKCFSADYLAQASARVSGCCWAMGQAVGRAATGKNHEIYD